MLHAVDGFWRRACAAGLGGIDEVSDRALGVAVTDHRSSWVRRVNIDTNIFYIKTYDYPTRRDRIRGALRTTWRAASRAAREAEALRWIRDQGLTCPRCLGVVEARRRGWLRRCVLVTEAFPGKPLDTLLPSLDRDEQDQVLTAVERLVSELHRRGFRDRNLDLRNLLAQRGDAGWQVVKIDSPRHRLLAPGAAHDRLAREDWQRLARSIDAVCPRRPERG